ncbi:MAG: hypothetical protein ABI729_00340, partial [Chitinophagales bacterium]
MEKGTHMNSNKFKFLFIACVVILFSCSTTKYTSEIIKENIAPEKVDSLYEEIQKLGLEFTEKYNVPGLAVAVI